MTYLVTGGVRSGKSSYAEKLAWHIAKEDVLYIATLSPSDDEMARRIARHQASRPAAWRTVEVLFSPTNALQDAGESVVLLDCLSGLVSNLLLKHEAKGEEAVTELILEQVSRLVDAVNQKTLIVVTNEVGAGVVPAYPLGRWYRDALGLANQQVARTADHVALLTVGISQTLKGDFPDLEQEN